MLSPDQVSGQILGHLGLVSATISKIGLIEQVDKRIPLSENHGSHVTMGERMAAMILNGLGFIDDRLYMFPEFLDDKPVARLFGKDLSAEHFNDDALGRCLDGIYEYGPTKLFSEIAFDIATEFGLLGKTARFDTTSISVFGEYNTPPQANPSSDKKEGKEPFRLAQGYSKDGRPDLKQMILTLATTGKSGFPIWASAHSGNTSDKEVLHRCASKMKKMTQGLKEAPSFLFVGDSAMYEKCARDSSGLLWLSRVPQVSNQAKELLSIKSEKLTWQELDKGYSISPQVTVYKNIKQRWLLVFSEQAFKREVKTLEKNILKEETTVGKQLWHLGNITFGCTSDANEALKPFKKGLKYHTVEDELEKILGYKGKGRPPKDAPKEVIGYKIKAKLRQSEAHIAAQKLHKGRFILATNQLDEKELSNENMLKEYKDQMYTERGFRFIKGNAFEVSSVFLKKESRIQALSMVMALTLMIYNVAQYFLRETLEKNGDTVPNQLGKQIAKPTFAWVCRMFQRVQVIQIRLAENTQEIVANLTDVLRKIVLYFGGNAAKIYGLCA